MHCLPVDSDNARHSPDPVTKNTNEVCTMYACNKSIKRERNKLSREQVQQLTLRVEMCDRDDMQTNCVCFLSNINNNSGEKWQNTDNEMKYTSK